MPTLYWVVQFLVIMVSGTWEVASAIGVDGVLTECDDLLNEIQAVCGTNADRGTFSFKGALG